MLSSEVQKKMDNKSPVIKKNGNKRIQTLSVTPKDYKQLKAAQSALSRLLAA